MAATRATATTLITLGTSSGVPTAERGNAAHVLVCDGQTYLFDCGEPLTQSLLRAQLDPLALSAVFLTHLHIDHLGGLPQLIQTLQIRGRNRPLPVHLPAEGIPPLAAFLEAVYLSADILPFALNLVSTVDGEIYADDRLRVTAHRNAHLETLRHRLGSGGEPRHPNWALESRSYVVETGDERIVFSGDLRGPDELRELLPTASALVSELVHFQPSALYPVLERAERLGDLILTHFHPNVETRRDEIVRECQRRLPAGARVHWASDGLVVTLAGPLGVASAAPAVAHGQR